MSSTGKRFSPAFSSAAQRLCNESSDLWAVHNEALARQEKGEDIIVMSVGDHDLPTIERIIEHAVTSLYRGRTHYSPGMGEPHLREKIAEIEIEASGKATSPDEVIIFPGATNALFTVLSCVLNPGDELIVPEPAYVGYQGMFQAIGHKVVPVRTDHQQGFSIDVESIKKAVTPSTRAVLINTPGNPSGYVMPAGDLENLADFCFQEDIWLICDEVYSMLTFEKPHVSARKAASQLDNVIIVDGLSKSHAMTGWRLGWVVAEESVIAHLLDFTSATVFGCSQFIQDAAAFALDNDAEYIATIVDEYRDRRDYSLDRIDAIEGLRCLKPDAGMFLMIDVSGIANSGDDFAVDLLAEQGVSVLPGSGFGESTSQFIRLSLTHEIPILGQAFDRIESFCRKQNS